MQALFPIGIIAMLALGVAQRVAGREALTASLSTHPASPETESRGELKAALKECFA